MLCSLFSYAHGRKYILPYFQYQIPNTENYLPIFKNEVQNGIHKIFLKI